MTVKSQMPGLDRGFYKIGSQNASYKLGLTNFRNKLLFWRLNLQWGEMNLIGWLFLVGSQELFSLIFIS